MLLSKCSHDLDIMSWLMGDNIPVTISSVGSVLQFKEEKAPEGAGTHCLNNCPLERECIYSARRLYIENPMRWANNVWHDTHSCPATDEEKEKILRQEDNPFSRCVYRCNINIVDHQSVLIHFRDGATGTFSMNGGATMPRRIIHVTGTGLAGILTAEAAGADEIIAAGLVNAEAAAKYILTRNPAAVSLVAMGKDGLENAKEDTLCAKYIESLLTGSQISGDDALPKIFRTRFFSSDQVQLIADALLTDSGELFFNPDPDWQEVYPRADFFLCTACDLFDFVIRISRDEHGILFAEPVPLG
jgi:hypothetical protein